MVMHRLFTYQALVRFTEFALLSVDLSYLSVLDPLTRFLVILLVTAIVYAILSISTYMLGINLAVSLALVTLITAVDAFLFVSLILAGTTSSISVYITSYINMLIDAVLMVLMVELLRV